HQDLPADARDGHRAGGVRVGRADPARRLVVELALEVPVELDLHAAVLVCVDLLARRPRHARRLHAVDAGPRGAARSTEALIARHDLEADAAALIARLDRQRVLALAIRLFEAEVELEADDDVLAGGGRVVEQLE